MSVQKERKMMLIVLGFDVEQSVNVITVNQHRKPRK